MEFGVAEDFQQLNVCIVRRVEQCVSWTVHRCVSICILAVCIVRIIVARVWMRERACMALCIRQQVNHVHVEKRLILFTFQPVLD
jgi:hypothetical protein